MKGYMYAETRTWNPYVGCLHDCIYCVPSFQQQIKRWGKKHCQLCYEYKPHFHSERLERVPSAKIVFVCGDGDIAFCDSDYLRRIVVAVAEHNKRCTYKTYYFQSKNWHASERVLGFLEMEDVRNSIILETLETNRDEGYRSISKAPLPTVRHKKFVELNWDRKVVTAEPLLDFDLEQFHKMIVETEPEYVWVGYNSRPNRVSLPEPPLEKVSKLIEGLRACGIMVKGKSLRGLDVSTVAVATQGGSHRLSVYFIQ